MLMIITRQNDCSQTQIFDYGTGQTTDSWLPWYDKSPAKTQITLNVCVCGGGDKNQPLARLCQIHASSAFLKRRVKLIWSAAPCCWCEGLEMIYRWVYWLQHPFMTNWFLTSFNCVFPSCLITAACDSSPCWVVGVKMAHVFKRSPITYSGIHLWNSRFVSWVNSQYLSVFCWFFF